MVQISRYPALGRTKVVMQTDVNGQKPDTTQKPDVIFFTWFFPIDYIYDQFSLIGLWSVDNTFAIRFRK